MTGELGQRAAELDAADPLAALREQFLLPHGVTYLDGNSLGALHRSVPDRLATVVRQEWGDGLIGSWAARWWDAPRRVGDRIAPLLGAAPGQVVVADSTSVNVFKVLVAGLRQSSPRDEIVLDAGTFPTDGYLADSVARLTGARVVRCAPDDLGDSVSERTALALLNHVDYRTGRMHDMAALTQSCHAVGALAVWDVSHSVGVLPLELDRLGIDLAVGATYKFLNGGPGAPAFVYVPTQAQATFDQPLTGWAGAADPFAMTPEYAPAATIDRARTGTPDILSLLALDAALDGWDDVDLAAVRTKGLALTGFFMDCVDELLAGTGVEIITPRTGDRGHQVSLKVSDPAGLTKRLAAHGVVVDHRPPELLRFGFAPLYVGFTDALRAVTVLASVLASVLAEDSQSDV